MVAVNHCDQAIPPSRMQLIDIYWLGFQAEEAESLKSMLAPSQLIKGTVSVMERVPEAAFGLSDLTANLCRQDDGKMRIPVLEQLLTHLRGTGPVEVHTHSCVLQEKACNAMLFMSPPA